MTVAFQGPRRPISMTLNEALVREAATLTPNLSDTVEALLATFVEAEKERRTRQSGADEQSYYDEMVAMAMKFHESHGVWGEEFSTL